MSIRRIGGRVLAVALLICSFGCFAYRSYATEASCSVEYVSAQHVYLDAGSAAGLAPGMQVRVVRAGETIARLEVIYTARSSASCKVLDSTREVAPGDTVVYDSEKPDGPAPEAPAPVAPRTRRAPQRNERPVSARNGARLTGSVALQWDQSVETDGGDLQTTRWRLPFRARATDLAGGLEFSTSGSLRRIERSGYPDYRADSEWRNRIRELSLQRTGRRQDLHFALGRIRTRASALAGPFDGFSVDHRWRQHLRAGVFAGFVPDWENLGFSTDTRLLGFGLELTRGLATGRRLDAYLAGVGRYHRDGVSREFLGWTATWSEGRRWRILHAAEVDLERGWKSASGGTKLRLTSIALTGRYRFSQRLSAELGYDDREPVRLWETRALPDSLFTDAGRSQWHARLRGEERGIYWSAGGGVRAPADGSAKTWSWNGRAQLPWRRQAMRFEVSARGFDGDWLSGWSPALGVERDFGDALRLEARTGTYRYTDSRGLPSRDSNWFEFAADRRFGRDWSLRGEWRNDWGSDVSGRRLFLEIARRF